MHRIDAHHHLWHYTPTEYSWIDERMAAISRDFIPDDLKPLLQTGGIDGAVSVQARQTLEETRWLLELADQQDILRGVVGWAPIVYNNFPAYLEEFDGRSKLKGLVM